MTTPDRYQPDEYGRYRVREQRRSSWNDTSTRLRAALSRTVLDALGAEAGDELVFRRNDRGEMVVEVDRGTE